MRSDRGSWGRVISGGLIFGAAAVFVSLVGMVEALGVRVIVIGVIDFGRLLLLLIGLGAGYQAARRGGGGVVIALLRGLLAGAATGAGLAALLVLGSVVNLRGMFINASPALFEIISFGRGAAGVPLVVAAGGGGGGLGGLGLNLEVGFAGLLDLGFVAFFASGAYTVGLLTSTGQYGIAHWSFWAAVPVALVVSLIAGFLFGLPILRIRGDYLAIATLGFGEIIRLLALSDALRPWFGGEGQ